MKIFKLTIYLTQGLFFCSTSLKAHDFFELEPVVVYGREYNLIGESISASEGHVGQVDLEYRPLLRTGELLEVVPGLIVTQHSGTGKANQYFLRGFNLDHGTDFATFVDGMPINMVTHAHGQGYTDLNFLIPELVQTVSYSKGSYYAAVGDFSAAGAAFFDTMDQLDSGIARFSAGEFDYYRGLIAESFQLTENTSLLAAFDATFYSGPWDIDEDLEQYKGLLKYSMQAEDLRYEITFMGYDSQWNSADQIPERAVRSGLISRLGSMDDTVGGETYRYSISNKIVLDKPDSRTALDLYAIAYDLNLWSNFTYFRDDSVNGDQFEQADNRMIYGGNLVHTLNNVAILDIPTRQTIGAQTRFDVIDEVGLYDTVERVRRNTVREDAVDQFSISLFYEGEFFVTEAFRAILGLRNDYHVFDVDSNLAANSGDEEDYLLSPKTSLIYTMSEQLEVYLSGGLGFHSNDARGTTITIDPDSGGPADRVDPLVRSTGAEVGARFTWNDKLNSSLALWWLELDSELLYVGDAGTTEASIGSERYGVEIANYFRPSEWLTLDLDLAFTESEFENGDEIPGALSTVISSGVTVVSQAGLFASLRGRYFGPRYLTEDGSEKSNSSLLFNLRTGYDVNEQLRIELDVLNLFDSNDDDITYFYESRISASEPVEADRHFHPIEPRSLRAAVTYRF